MNHVISQSFLGLDTWDCLALYCTFISAFLAKERQGFAALFGIHVALCFDGVLLSVIVSCYVYHFPYSHLLQLDI